MRIEIPHRNARNWQTSLRVDYLRAIGAKLDDCPKCEALGGWTAEDGSERWVCCPQCWGVGKIEVETDEED